MFTLSIVIHYPETVDGEVSITATTAPVRLVAQQLGDFILCSSLELTLDQGKC